MNIIEMELTSLSENKDNVRKHGTKQIQEFKRAIESFDVIRPIVADENGVILCGHGLFMALKECGRSTAPVIVKAGLTEEQKKKLMLADNKIYSLGSDDYDKIDEILSQMSDFDVPGFSSADLEALYGATSIANQVSMEPPAPVSAKKEDAPAAAQNKAERVEQAVTSAREEYEASEGMHVMCPECGTMVEVP